MDITFDRYEFDSIINTLKIMLEAFRLVTEYLSLSIRDIVELTAGSFIAQTLPDWLGTLSPLTLMLGVSLPLYLGYQLITWVLNSVT